MIRASILLILTITFYHFSMDPIEFSRLVTSEVSAVEPDDHKLSGSLRQPPADPRETREHTILQRLKDANVALDEALAKPVFNEDEFIHKTLEKEGLTEPPYHINSQEEALDEIQNPKPVPIPTNGDIFIRDVVLRHYLAPRGKDYPSLFPIKAKYSFFFHLLAPILHENGNVIFSSTVNVFREDKSEDYKQLAWRVGMPSAFESGSVANMSVSVNNISEDDATLSFIATDADFFYLQSIIIKRIASSAVVTLTPKGVSNYYSIEPIIARDSVLPPIILKPGESFKLPDQSFDLSENYDLSEPGEYELTFYTRRFIDENGDPAEDQELEYPRKATVRFTILPKGEDEASSAE